MIKVLEVTESLACGGRESFAVNVLRNINHEDFSIDFFSLTSKKQFYTDEVLKLGCRVLSSETERVDAGLLIFLRKNLYLAKVVRNEEYDIVHIHADTHLDYLKVILIDLFSNSKIVFHAHGATELRNPYKRIMGRICRILGKDIPFVNIACSKSATEYFYKNSTNSIVVNNPIEISKFGYSIDFRNEIRKKMNIKPQTMVIGHVGRFSKEKNHYFLINLFQHLVEKCNDAKLILIGEGPLKAEIIKMVETRGIKDKVILVDSMKDIYKIYSAIDCFWFPSLKESFGNTAIEAQLSGTPVITSKGVPKEVLINKNTERHDYDFNKWINSTLSLQRDYNFKIDNFLRFSSSTITKTIEQIYKECINASR